MRITSACALTTAGMPIAVSSAEPAGLLSNARRDTLVIMTTPSPGSILRRTTLECSGPQSRLQISAVDAVRSAAPLAKSRIVNEVRRRLLAGSFRDPENDFNRCERCEQVGASLHLHHMHYRFLGNGQPEVSDSRDLISR